MEENSQPKLALNVQYLKDLSFESPSAPMGLVGGNISPKIDISLDLNAKKIETGHYEVEIKINAKAGTEEVTLFIVEVSYAGLFTIENINDEVLNKVLLIDCPTILFPYVRRIISDATRDGGFQPLMIDPIDFVSLYMARQKESTIN